jgi:hypothetical protein
METQMFAKSIAAGALAVFLTTTAALAQYASPGPTYVPEGYYAPNGYDVPNGHVTPHQRRGAGDANGW